MKNRQHRGAIQEIFFLRRTKYAKVNFKRKAVQKTNVKKIYSTRNIKKKRVYQSEFQQKGIPEKHIKENSSYTKRLFYQIDFEYRTAHPRKSSSNAGHCQHAVQTK